MIAWIARQLGWRKSTATKRALWSDEEVIADVLERLGECGVPSAESIANRYTYPMKYVQEVLHPILEGAIELRPTEGAAYASYDNTGLSYGGHPVDAQDRGAHPVPGHHRSGG